MTRPRPTLYGLPPTRDHSEAQAAGAARMQRNADWLTNWARNNDARLDRHVADLLSANVLTFCDKRPPKPEWVDELGGDDVA